MTRPLTVGLLVDLLLLCSCDIPRPLEPQCGDSAERIPSERPATVVSDRSSVETRSGSKITRISTGSTADWLGGGSVIANQPTCEAGSCDAKIYQLNVCSFIGGCDDGDGANYLAISNCPPIVLRGPEGGTMSNLDPTAQVAFRYVEAGGVSSEDTVVIPVTFELRYLGGPDNRSRYSGDVELRFTGTLESLGLKFDNHLTWNVVPAP